MSHFKYHLFFCSNQREAGQMCCNNHGASAMLAYAKDKAKALKIDGNRIRINKAGCLGRCDQGPVMVVYPEETWYSFIDNEDLDEIIQEHLLNDRVVERLKL